MEHPSSPRADAAYARALAAYKEKSYDVARRWANETLAHNPHHAGAKDLLTRLDTSRPAASPFDTTPPGSEVISTDPTVLISRSRTPPTAAPVDPTVVVSRDDTRRHVQDIDAGWTPPPSRPAASRPQPPPPPRAPAPRPDHSGDDPTVMAPARNRPAARPKSKSPGGAFAGLFLWLRGVTQGGARRAGHQSSTHGALSTPAARGALLAIGTVLAGALLVWMSLAAVRWLSSDTKVLTITKPTGGTVLGPGIECGTGGDRCTASITTGEPIELDTRPDNEFVFSGYTGDCAPTGRTAMTEARTCGARFDRVVTSAAATTFRLTISKPEGGTIVASGGILCGVNGSTCTADIPSGAPVSLKADAAEGFAWEQFTGDCPSTGDMVMTGPKTCGAVFIKSAAPINVGPATRPQATPPVRRPTPPVVATRPPATPAPPPDQAPPNQQQGSLLHVPTGPAPTPTVPDKPAPPPISADDHAKQEIGRLVNNYCAALGTLNPSVVRKLFHLDNERALRDQYKEYKSLKCTVASPPEYDRLDSSEAGGAQLKFGMKQATEMKSGGAPKSLEYIVTMVVSRRAFQSPWLIDRVTYEPKPK